MSVTAHIQELKRKHAALSEAVETAQRMPATDTLQLTELKRQKLKLKEEIERLSA